MLARNRGRAWIAEGRQVAMYLAHVIGQVPVSEAAPHFGRDRTTLAHACARIEDRRDEARFDDGLGALEARMQQRLGEMKLQRLLAEEVRRVRTAGSDGGADGAGPDAGAAAPQCAADRDHEISVEKPVVIRTARGRFYLFEPVPAAGPEQ